MSRTLVIVESPAKCKKIESFLGTNYTCLASFGHIRELDTKRGLSCIDIQNQFTPSFIESASKKGNIQKLRSALRNCSEVVLATDDDREGEAIAWHICQVLNISISATKRIIFHEVTKAALQRAITNPTRIDMNKVNAQLARQILDLLVGFTISPILWRHVSQFKKGSLSAGRCQTPALRIIYDNQKEIDASPGKTGYDITGYFTEHNLPYKLNKRIETEEDAGQFLENSIEHKHLLKRFKPIDIKKRAPIPLTTSAIQQKASTVLRFSPKVTMRSCQMLYEAGYITYMRTDSKSYSKEFLKQTQTFVEETYGDPYVKPNLFSLSVQTGSSKSTKKTKKGKKADHAQEAHEAIRPTNITRTHITQSSKITNREIKLYKLIWTHALESCMADASYKTMKTIISAPQSYHYKYSCEQVIFPGWKIVAGYEKVNPTFEYLQTIQIKKSLKYHKIKANFSLFELKTHYGEAKLVNLLEKKGIGRPSTFASLITKIQDRDYVKKQDVQGKTIECIDFELIEDTIEEIEHSKVVGGEKNKMVITPTGLVVIEFLLEHFDSIFCYDYTKNMEDILDVIATGEKLWHTLCKTCHIELTKQCETIQKDHTEQFDIDENHSYMIGRYGPVIKIKMDGKTTFRSVKKGISLENLKNGTLSIEDVIEEKKVYHSDVGSYKGHEVVVKNGKFGLYAQWNMKNYSLKNLDKELSDVILNDIKPYLEGTKHANPNILRVLTPDISLRKGKYGQYIFYKTSAMSKPRFLKLQDFDASPDTCDISILLDWVRDTYSI